MKRLFSFIKTIVFLLVIFIAINRMTSFKIADIEAAVRSYLPLKQENEIAVQKYNEKIVIDEPAQFYGTVQKDEPKDNAPEPVQVQPQEQSEVFYPYYEMLTPTEQQVYDIVLKAASELKTDIPLTQKITIQQMERAVSAVLFDRPELFWLESEYSYTYDDQKMVSEVTLHFNETANYITAARKRFDDKVQAIVQQAKELDTDLERELFVHDILVKSIKYDKNALLHQSAYSALVFGNSVCAGYTRAFQLIMQQLGIPCYYCAGYANEEHAWNIIKLDEEYHNVDISWNDTAGNADNEMYYDYFNISDKRIGYDHERRGLSQELPKCQSNELSYFNLYGWDENKLHTELYTLNELGYSNEQVIENMDDYYNYCHDLVLADGVGTHTHTVLLKNEALCKKISKALDSQKLFEKAIIPAAQKLELNGYTAKVEFTSRQTRDGFVIVNQTITLNSER
ncbi:MAG: hypothetical protein IKV41_03335 [Oscillospiraceae bacterium]|nr:hypothetical protein [Oscillospiraceae bacterium]